MRSSNLGQARRGISTVTAIFMLLLMFAALTGLIVAYFNFDLSTQEQMKIEHERSQEKIVITNLKLDNELSVANLTISNIGAIEVKIRALYRQEGGETIFLADPSMYMDTYIAIGESLVIDTTSFGYMPDPDTILIAATERGTKSLGVNEIELTLGNLPPDLNTSQLTVGPLMLTFTSLQWTATFDNDGNPIWPDSANGWIIKSTSPRHCAWRINVTNVDPEGNDLSINQFSGFTIVGADSPQAITWYLDAAQQTLNHNQTSSITFTGSEGGNFNQQPEVNNVFLTFFGYYENGIPFAQTIPFQAITVVKK